MTSEKLMQKLVIERCRVHVSHLCALNHLNDDGQPIAFSKSYVDGVIANLNRDFELIEYLIAQEG